MPLYIDQKVEVLEKEARQQLTLVVELSCLEKGQKNNRQIRKSS